MIDPSRKEEFDRKFRLHIEKFRNLDSAISEKYKDETGFDKHKEEHKVLLVKANLERMELIKKYSIEED